MTTILDSEAPLTFTCLQFVITVCDLFASSTLRSPLALLILWWSLCLYFQLIVLNLIPLFVLIWFSFKWKNIKKPQENITLHQLILKLEQRLSFTAYLSWERGNARKSFIYFVSAYFIWISLQQVLTIPILFVITGSSFIILNSEWSLPLKNSFNTMKNRFTRDKSHESLWERVRNLEQQDDQQQSTFLFEIYENQRYNFFNGQWEGTTFPFERSPWTDSVHYPVSSKSQTALPFFWNWIDDDWSAGPWSYGTIIWTTNKGNKWYHNKTRRRLWARTASTVYDGSSRRRSSVFYSQKSTVYEFPIEEKPADQCFLNNENQDATTKEDIGFESDHIEKEPVTPPLDEERADSPFIPLFPKPPQGPLCDDEGSVTSASTDSISTCVPKTKSEYTSFYRHSKRLSSTTSSRDAIWKSIAKV